LRGIRINIQSRGITEGPTFSLLGKEKEIMKNIIESIIKNNGSNILLRYFLSGVRFTEYPVTKNIITKKRIRKFNAFPLASFAIKLVASVLIMPIF